MDLAESYQAVQSAAIWAWVSIFLECAAMVLDAGLKRRLINCQRMGLTYDGCRRPVTVFPFFKFYVLERSY